MSFLRHAGYFPPHVPLPPKQILIPAISNVWNDHQSEVIAAAGAEPLTLGGDGRADSPGHCAKFGSYSVMDLIQNKILDVQLVQVNVDVLP
jgi:hypothetical protein